MCMSDIKLSKPKHIYYKQDIQMKPLKNAIIWSKYPFLAPCKFISLPIRWISFKKPICFKVFPSSEWCLDYKKYHFWSGPFNLTYSTLEAHCEVSQHLNLKNLNCSYKFDLSLKI